MNRDPLLLRLVVTLCAVAAFAMGCLAPDSDTVTANDSIPDVQTGILGSECFLDADCALPLICLCGQCTQACSAPDSCALGAQGTGFDVDCLAGVELAESGLCGLGLGEGGICVARCAEASDCAGDPFTYTCADGVCEPQANGGVFTDVGMRDTGAADGDDGGERDAGASDVDAADTAVVGCDGGTVIGPDPGDAMERLRECSEIAGDLEIRDVEDLDLTVFAALTTVSGDLRIIGGSVTNAEAVELPALISVGGEFELDGVRVNGTRAVSVGAPLLEQAGNVVLRSFDTDRIALDALRTVDGGLEVRDVFVVELALYQLELVGRDGVTLQGVNGLSRVELRRLRSAGAMVLERLPTVTQVLLDAWTNNTRELRLRELPVLVSISTGFVTVEDALELRGLERLSDLSGFSSVSSGGSWRELVIAENASLRGLGTIGLAPAIRTAGTLSVADNPELQSLGALGNVGTIASSVDVSVVNNAMLPACEVRQWLLEAWDEADDIALESAVIGNDDVSACN